MIDAIAIDLQRPAIVKHERRGGNRNGGRTDSRHGGRTRGPTALAVGTVIILDDGTQCEIVAFTRTGEPICATE